MEITAQLNDLRIAPRKVRLVCGALKGLDASHARVQLNYLTKRSAKPLAKLLNSALANAQNNFGLVQENMYIKRIEVGEGSKLKRFRPKGFGMASPVEKKTAHIRLVLDERVPGLKAEKKAKPAAPPETKAEKAEKLEKKPVYQPAEKEVKKPGMLGNLKRKFFRRKAI